MGFALIWTEGLAVALLSLALATAWRTRGSGARWLWLALVPVVFFTPAALAVAGTYAIYLRHGNLVRTPWFFYTLSWLVAFTVLGVILMRRGLRRPEAGLARAAATWPRRSLWLGFGAALLAFGFTVWNMDLAARADLGIARQEAGAVLLTMTVPPVPESENAALVYAEAIKELGAEVRNPWKDAARAGLDNQEQPDWQDPYVVGLVKEQENTLALLRKAAALPHCNFERPRAILDAVMETRWQIRLPGQGAVLLAVDARVKATQGNLARALEDVSAILGIVRHVSAEFGLVWGWEAMAWRTLEDVLRLAPPGKEPLPALAIPSLPPLIRTLRAEYARLGMVLIAAASQPDPIIKEEWERSKPHAPWQALLLQAAVVPTRVFIIPDELVAMHKLFEDYQQAPRSVRDETPTDWADLRKSVETDPTSIYGAFFVKPKQEVLLAQGSSLAVLRQTARTGLAATAYRRKHGQYPERLEQLVPDFLPALPVDPRDGQPLRLKRVAEELVLYAPQDSAAVEAGKVRETEGRRPPPIFRLFTAPARP